MPASFKSGPPKTGIFFFGAKCWILFGVRHFPLPKNPTVSYPSFPVLGRGGFANTVWCTLYGSIPVHLFQAFFWSQSSLLNRSKNTKARNDGSPFSTLHGKNHCRPVARNFGRLGGAIKIHRWDGGSGHKRELPKAQGLANAQSGFRTGSKLKTLTLAFFFSMSTCCR